MLLYPLTCDLLLRNSRGYFYQIVVLITLQAAIAQIMKYHSVPILVNKCCVLDLTICDPQFSGTQIFVS